MSFQHLDVGSIHSNSYPFLNATAPVSSAVTIGRIVANVEVLVTGFGPFGNLDPNPSYEIISQIPYIIIDDDGSGPDIQVHKYPEPVRVTYDGVSQLVPELYGSYLNVDFFVHLGALHEGSCQHHLERKARKGPFLKLDVDGKIYKDGAWDNAPHEIISSVDVDRIVGKMTMEDKWDIEVSDDCGLFLCEFIYYNSLLQAQKVNEEGRNVHVAFIHVPLGNDGGDTVAQVIREIIKSQ